MVDFEKLLKQDQIKEKLREKNMANKNTSTKQTQVSQVRNFAPSNKGMAYDFENTEKLQEFLDQNFEVLNGFVKMSEKYETEQLTMIIKIAGETKTHTVKTSSKIIIEQFKEQLDLGLPFAAKVVEVASKESDYTYLSLMPAD